MNVIHKAFPFRAIGLMLLLCTSFPQPVESFNAIINSSPLTIWIYNYLRANDCLGLPICDIIDASNGATADADADDEDEPPLVGTGTGSIEVSDETISDIYDGDGNNEPVALGNGTLSGIFQGMIQEEEEDRDDIPDVVQDPEYDGPDLVLYPEVSEKQSSPTGVFDAGMNIVEGFLEHISLFGGHNRRLLYTSSHQQQQQQQQQQRKHLRA